jgi:pimeloyl-ACP methyl ester carboxylesterase
LILNYREYGAGAPLVVAHGVFGSSRNWTSIARALARQRRVIALDLRNHGQSGAAASMSYPEMAADVADTLDALDLPAVALLGHSMGGKTLMQFALEHRDRAQLLIVVDVAPVAFPPAHVRQFERIVDALLDLPIAEIDTRADADQRLARSVSDPATRGFLLQNLERTEKGWRWRIDLHAIRAGLPNVMSFPGWSGPSYAGPTLFLRGGRSVGVLPEHEARIRALFPRSRIETIADAGHNPHTETPGQFLAQVEAFLRAA